MRENDIACHFKKTLIVVMVVLVMKMMETKIIVVNDWMDCEDRCRVNVKQFVNDDGDWFAFMTRILKGIMTSFRP